MAPHILSGVSNYSDGSDILSDSDDGSIPSLCLYDDSLVDESILSKAESNVLSDSNADSIPSLYRDEDSSKDSSSIWFGDEFTVGLTASDILFDWLQTISLTSDDLSDLSQLLASDIPSDWLSFSIIKISAPNLELPNSFKTLYHPQVWIADTSASIVIVN